MEILLIKTKFKYRPTGVDEGVVIVEGEILTVCDPKESIDEDSVAELFKKKQREEMEKYNRNLVSECIDYGLSFKRRQYEYYKEYWLSELPVDKVIVIKKWKLKMEVKVYDKDYSEYLDMVADYKDIIDNPEVNVMSDE